MTALRCPLCRGELVRTGQRFLCAERHAYDVAREGSVHLLPQRLRSKALGDSAEMLRARRAFFDAGHFAPLMDAVGAAVIDLAKTTSPVVVDIGCGEGSYLGHVVDTATRLAAFDDEAQYIGFDVASYGVKRAAARTKRALFAVSDLYCGLPLKDASVDVITCIFAPRDEKEFARVLKPNGHVVVVVPMPEHLEALRAHAPLIAIEAGKSERLRAGFASDFDELGADLVRWTMTLDGQACSTLVQMTPTQRHLPPDALERLETLGPTDVDGAVQLFRFRKAN